MRRDLGGVGVPGENADSQASLRTSWPGLPACKTPGAELSGGALPQAWRAQLAGLLGDRALS